MSEQEREPNPSLDTLHGIMNAVSWGDRALGMLEHPLHHALEPAAPLLGAILGPLGFVSGAGEAILGAQEAYHGSGRARSDGIVDTMKGGLGMVSGLGSFLSAGGAFGAAGAAGTGFLGTGLTAGAAAGPLAAAGATGLAIGTGISHHMEGNQVGGLYGKDDVGRSRDVGDWPIRSAACAPGPPARGRCRSTAPRSPRRDPRPPRRR